jgi:hypothetical protein
MRASAKTAIRRLQEAKDGSEAIDGIKKLARLAQTGDTEALVAIAEYTRVGAIESSRWFACSCLVDLSPAKTVDLSPYFIDALKVPSTCYFAISGLVKTARSDSFQYLVDLALDENVPLECRANAVVEMSMQSQQPFDRFTPRDHSKWESSDFRVEEIKIWRDSGFPPGKGSDTPERHHTLDLPETRFEKTVSRFDAKLAKVRMQDPSNKTNPANYLSPCSPSILATIEQTWKLPFNYRVFLERYSPVNLICSLTAPMSEDDFWLYSAEELLNGQRNFAHSMTSGEPFPEWPRNYLVFGQAFGRPYIFDLGRSDLIDTAVLTAEPEQDDWTFETCSSSFEQFLGSLSVNPL